MKVKKRNGKLEEVQFDKITKRISRLLSKDDSLSKIIDPIQISQKICNRVYDQIPTSELDILASAEWKIPLPLVHLIIQYFLFI